MLVLSVGAVLNLAARTARVMSQHRSGEGVITRGPDLIGPGNPYFDR